MIPVYLGGSKELRSQPGSYRETISCSVSDPRYVRWLLMIASAVESLIYNPGFRQRQSTHFTYTWALLKDYLLGINEGVVRPMAYIIHHIRSTTHSALHVTNSVSSISTTPPPLPQCRSLVRPLSVDCVVSCCRAYKLNVVES